MIHSIFLVQFTCWTVLFHKLFPGPLWSTSWYWTLYSGVKLGRIPPDHRSGISYLRSTTSNNRSCTPQLRSGTFLLGSTLCRVYIWVFFCVCIMFCKTCSPSRSFCHLHLSTLGVDRCCKRKTLFKCHKSQAECLEYSKTPGRRLGTPPLLSILRARASALQALCL